MKKLSLLIALCMLISIGGVYANWVYMEGAAGSAHEHVGSFGLSSASNTGSKGTITANGQGAHITIDPDGDSYRAKLTFTGKFVITFTPDADWAAANAGKDTFDVEWVLTTTNQDPTNYLVACDVGTAKLFTTFDTTAQTLTLRKSGNVYTAELSAELLASLITLGNFSLDDYETYTKCSADIGKFGNIGITVNEKGASGAGH